MSILNPPRQPHRPTRAGGACAPAGPRGSRSGFTILELALVLVALSLAAALSIPAWFGRSEVTLDSAARLLARDLRDVQNLAALRGAVLFVDFFEDGDGYRVVDAEGAAVPAPPGHGGFTRIYSRDAVFRGVRIEVADFGGGRRARFDDVGYAHAGGVVVLRYGVDARVLRLAEHTGLLEIHGLARPWIDSGN